MGQTIEPNIRTERPSKVWGHWLSMYKALDVMGKGAEPGKKHMTPRKDKANAEVPAYRGGAHLLTSWYSTTSSLVRVQTA